jgi:monofunctional biosynthetic peptidoglycan transglycosylase
MDSRITPEKGPKSRIRWAYNIVSAILGIIVVMPVALLLAFRFLPVPATPQMAATALDGQTVHYRWAEAEDISPYLGRAVIASEDQKFCSHHGFDWDSINSALRAHDRGGRLRGASTISQQTARSLMLLPVRSWIRKGMEAYITVLMEALWPKKRILTAYLNLANWGHGNFGAEAAAQAYFETSAARLTPEEASRLAAILPDPEKWRAARPGPYVAGRSETVVARMGEVRRDDLDSCVRP